MNATDKTYNGWTNYETWNVALWKDNDEGSYSYWQEVAQEIYDDAEAGQVLTRDEEAAQALAERLKDEYEDAMHEMLKTANQQSSMWADLLGAALSEVNWDEIASGMIEEVDKDEPEADVGDGEV